MEKINILVIPSDKYGVGFFRFIEPHMEIQKQFKDEVDVKINFEPDWSDEKYFENFNIIFGSKNMLSIDNAKEILPRLRSKGIKLVIDIDDHWVLDKTHPQYEMAKKIKHGENSIEFMKLVDYITTTTDYFASEIKKQNKNVEVFPNGIDPTSKKFQIKDENPSDKVRLGWLGGSSHMQDLKLLYPMFTSILTKYTDKIQTVLCGFDLSGVLKERTPDGKVTERPYRPEETPWYYYEKIFTSDYKNIDNEYLEHLKKYKNAPYPGEETKTYRRVWTKPLSTYSLNYNLFDISLVPLVNNTFNLAKSQLKIIEAGFFKKPVIASDVKPYQIDIKHGENGFLVKEGSNKDWSYYAKKLIDSPELRKEMGEKLYESVKDKYDIRNISRDRFEWYKTIISK